MYATPVVVFATLPFYSHLTAYLDYLNYYI
ncbi:Uncharacterised protein [Legionella beliardensis]|uniref:Uncharacterized protein n=1 Tax=Legionella beliardensis TaxID=91822 RepID=A0A378JQX4_9GAMM|nr:Uncharacterised protein [Legionella beliardensis]